MSVVTKLFRAWECDCPPDDGHQPQFCVHRRPVLVQRTSDPDWRVPAPRLPDKREPGIPAPVVSARPARLEEIPPAALRVADAALAKGWPVVATYALGWDSPPQEGGGKRDCPVCGKEVTLSKEGKPRPHGPKTNRCEGSGVLLDTTPQLGPPKVSIALRAAPHFVATWIAGSFSGAWVNRGGRLVRLSAAELAELVKS